MNKPLKIAICEDLADDTALLRRCIHKAGISTIIKCFPSGESFLDVFQKGLFHLVFLDIYMGGISGIQTAAAIREKDGGVPIVFTTTSRDHALEANHYLSILYIEKPVTPETVAHCLNIAEALREKRLRDVISVATGDRQHIDLPFDDIIYIEVSDHRCKISTTEDIIEVTTSVTIDDLAAKLPPPRFLRCHRSYIVNLDHVKSIDKDFTMEGGHTVYIRVKDYKKIKTAYEHYLFAQLRGENN